MLIGRFWYYQLEKVIELSYLVPVWQDNSEKCVLCVIQFSRNALSKSILIWPAIVWQFSCTTSTTARLQLFHFCSSLSHGTSCRVHLLVKLLSVAINLILCLRHVLITFVCPGIAQLNVTHLARSSTGWEHEWADSRELLCFFSWSGSRYFFRCWHRSHSAESMTAPFHAFPPWAWGLSAAFTTSNKCFIFLPKMPHRYTTVHVGSCSFHEQL